MKDFMVVDDDCMDLFEEMQKNQDGSYLVAPINIIRKMLFWILGEDDGAKLGAIMIDADYDGDDDTAYLLAYTPEDEVNIGAMTLCFCIDKSNQPLYIYDQLSSKYLDYVNKDMTTPFHFYSEDKAAMDKKAEAKYNKMDNNKITDLDSHFDRSVSFYDDLVTINDIGIPGFTEYSSDNDGNYSSYSFYSTDEDLVKQMAERREKLRKDKN